jgi:hypothetical protein
LPYTDLPHGTQDGRGREDEKEQGNPERDYGDGDRKGDEWLDNEEIEQCLV